MSLRNTYNIVPAGPVLGHSLLPLSTQSATNMNVVLGSEHRGPEPNPAETWNLRLDIERGLHSSSKTFSPGTIIGFSRLQVISPSGSDDEFTGELPRNLLIDWLYRTMSTDTTPISRTRAFIIHPANLAVFSPEKLLASLLSSQPHSLSRTQAISYLDSVQLFPVFDFVAAVQAINEVSDLLHETRAARQPKDDSDPESGNAIQHSAGSKANYSITFIIAGLDTLAEAVIRASNAVRGTAVLSSALRTLAQLSRMHQSYLSIVLVNTSGVGPTMRDNTGNKLAQSQAHSRGHQNRDDGPHSMFSTADTFLFPTLLMRTLDQGIDTHLLVSNTRKSAVVEVIKDRVGSGVGKWCAWDSNR